MAGRRGSEKPNRGAAAANMWIYMDTVSKYRTEERTGILEGERIRMLTHLFPIHKSLWGVTFVLSRHPATVQWLFRRGYSRLHNLSSRAADKRKAHKSNATHPGLLATKAVNCICEHTKAGHINIHELGLQNGPRNLRFRNYFQGHTAFIAHFCGQ